MAYFAELDQNNVVLRVVAVNNNDVKDVNGNENEQVGILFCKKLFGHNTTWIQTSFNGRIRKRFAPVNGTYDSQLDAFIFAKPYPSWVLNQDLEWTAPIPYPTDGKRYNWDETTQSWVEIVQPVSTGTQKV